MNKRIQELTVQARIQMCSDARLQEFAELVIKDCANYIRETYDHEDAESIAWCLELNYGLHGDYA